MFAGLGKRMGRNSVGLLLLLLLLWLRGTESPVPDVTKWPIVPALEGDECGAVGRMLGKEN
jgi:hypothetical protein